MPYTLVRVLQLSFPDRGNFGYVSLRISDLRNSLPTVVTRQVGHIVMHTCYEKESTDRCNRRRERFGSPPVGQIRE